MPDGSTTFTEVYGHLETRSGSAASSDIVMLTNVVGCGSGTSRPLNGLTLRYVARGEEVYRIGGKPFRLPEGQIMLARQDDGADVDIRSVDRRGTLGLCAFIAANDDRDIGELAGPIVLDASCSPIGELMRAKLKSLAAPAPTAAKSAQAADLVGELLRHVPRLLTELEDQADSIQAAKPSTRFEALRKVNIARSYLHSVTGRVVSLDELASVAGTSRFHLQRTFQQCVGATPSMYHRRLRLTLALEEAKRRGLPLYTIADEFGFAGVSSLSHAYRRAFGRPPIWNKRVGLGD